MQIQANFDIPNTLALRSVARLGGVASTLEDIVVAKHAARQAGVAFICLGEGSNVVATPAVDALVCINRIAGFNIVDEDLDGLRLHVAAGENWHACVLRAVAMNLYGLENLALIPGSAGAAPIQNIGAYGVEIAQHIESVEVIDGEGVLTQLDADMCEFGYRDSIFKRRADWTVVGMTLRLQKSGDLNLSYPGIAAAMQGDPQSYRPESVVAAVSAVRMAKLPDPARVPNAGSFFKNPLVPRSHYLRLAEQIQNLQGFAMPGGYKLSAAQLIDLAGWKAKASPTVECWQTQPLVLVNTGTDTAADVLAYADAIRADIQQRFQVELELEPSVIR